MADSVIDFGSIFEKEAEKVSTTQTPAQPANPSDNVKTANTVADTAVAVSEAVVPGVTEAPITGTEGTVLSVENSIQKIFSIIPGASPLSGFVLPAEIVTHLGFAFFHLLSHHVKTTTAQQAAATATK